MTCCYAPWLPIRRPISRASCSRTVFSEFGTYSDQTRAEFIRAQCAGASTDARAVFTAHAWRWAGLPNPPHEWAVDVESALTSFERGFATQLRLSADGVPICEVLRRLFAHEPVAEVLFQVGRVRPNSATRARSLLPFSRPVTVTVTRAPGNGHGYQDAFLTALLSSPVMSTAAAVALAGLSPGRSGSLLVYALAQSPFFGRVQRLNLSHNRLGDTEACGLARMLRLENVVSLSLAQNRIGDTGALALASSPHLRNVSRLDVTGNRFTDAGREALLKRFGPGTVFGS